MIVAKDNNTLLTVTDKGYGKRTIIEDYRLINRGGRGVILQDKIPNIEKIDPVPLEGKTGTLLFICTFHRDEPFEEVFKAAGMRGMENITIYVTGNHKKANIYQKDVPDNVILTGFVSEER